MEAKARLRPIAPDAEGSDGPDATGALVERQALLLTLVAELLGAKDLQAALDAFVGELQLRPGAERVCLGIVSEAGAVTVRAVSQQAVIDLASDEVRLISDAMQECLVLERTVRYPPPGDGVAVDEIGAHHALGAPLSTRSLLSVPLFQASEPVGVLLLERDRVHPFDDETLELLEQIAAACAAPVHLHREAARGAFERFGRTASGAMRERFGEGRRGARALLAVALVMGAGLALLPLPHHIVARAELVPQEHRFVTAPYEGFVDAVLVRAGESVRAQQPLARMELRELELEATRRDGELAGAEAEFRSAMASHDRKATAITRARLESERAQRALIEQRKQRIELRAPIDGVVVNGDPTDKVGAPVSRGEVLFEVARQDGYEVHAMVHERDIREVHTGQRGQLTLSARPGEDLDVRVDAIHPVAESADGASRFRVRASLEHPVGVTLRPGESGNVRLEAGRANLISLLGRPVVQKLTELWWRFSW